MVFGIFITGCTSTHNNETGKDSGVQAEDTSKTMSDTITVCSVPAPLQIVRRLKEINPNFHDELLDPTNKKGLSGVGSTVKMALTLGIYSVDLGYSVVYDRGQDIINYFAKCKSLGESLGIDGAFGPPVSVRIRNNLHDMDTLSRITLSSFNEVNDFFNNNDRQDDAVLVLAGGFIEGLYLSANIAKINNNPEEKKIVASQKFFLESFLQLLEPSETRPEINDLIENFKSLQEEYATISVTYCKDSDPNKKKVDRILMTEKTFDNILAKINELRGWSLK